MKIVKLALAAACAIGSTAASANVVVKQPQGATSDVNTCYYEYSIITREAIYDVYYCYDNGDGSY